MLQKRYFSIIFIFYCFSTAALFTVCEKSESLLFSGIGDLYEYTAFDSSGTTVAQGWLFLKLKDNLVRGEWDIEAVGLPQNIGPQTGSGNLLGGYSSDSIWVDLQPQMRDNNLLLNGRLTDNNFSGKWIYISFIGPTNAGIFLAKRKFW